MACKQMFRMDRKPEPVSDSPDSKKSKKKWPKEVFVANSQVFSEKSFYNWTFKEQSSHLWSYLIVGLVVFILLFPVWPDIGKIITFYISLYLLIFLVDYPNSSARFHLSKIGCLHDHEAFWLRVVDPA